MTGSVISHADFVIGIHDADGYAASAWCGDRREKMGHHQFSEALYVIGLQLNGRLLDFNDDEMSWKYPQNLKSGRQICKNAKNVILPA